MGSESLVNTQIEQAVKLGVGSASEGQNGFKPPPTTHQSFRIMWL